MRKIKKIFYSFICLITILLCVSCGNIENASGKHFLWWELPEEYYACTIEFFVNPEGPKDTVGEDGGSQYDVYGTYGRHVMDNMVKLLSSDSFTEILISGMENVPEKTVVDTDTGETILSSEYKTLLEKVKRSISFSYLEADENFESANNLARNLIYATISVPIEEGQEFAEILKDRVCSEVPIYVEDNMAVPTDYKGTNCEIVNNEEIKIIKK